MTETQILGFATHNAPNSRTTAGNERFELLALEATYDGTAAGGDFVPAVQIVSDAGVVVGTFPLASSLAVGDSATITWAPFLRNGVGLTGIYYDFANIGDYLNVEATGHSPAAFTVGGESSNWSIGLDGDAVALGGTTQAWLVSPNLVELSSPGGSIINDAGAAGAWQVNTGLAQITTHTTFEVDATGDANVNSSANINVEAGSAVGIFADTGEVRLKALGTNAEFFLSHNGNVTARIGSGRTFTLLGDLGNTMLQMTDGSPNLHLPTGGAVIFDL